MTTTYDMNDTATMAHDPYVSEYGEGYGVAYGTGYDTDHGSTHAVGGAYDDGRAMGGAYGGGYGTGDGYAAGHGMGGHGTGTDALGDADTTGGDGTGADADKPSVGSRVDTAIDAMKSTFDKVVGTAKDKLADGGWERAERRADDGTGDDNITYNQIHEAMPDPSEGGEQTYGGSSATASMHGTSAQGGDKQTGGVGGGSGAHGVTNANGSYGNTMGTVSDDCGAVSGRACGTRQGDDYGGASNVDRVYNDIATSTWDEYEI